MLLSKFRSVHSLVNGTDMRITYNEVSALNNFGNFLVQDGCRRWRYAPQVVRSRISLVSLSVLVDAICALYGSHTECL